MSGVRCQDGWNGVLEWWSNGVMGWSNGVKKIGVVECWDNGVLDLWSNGVVRWVGRIGIVDTKN